MLVCTAATPPDARSPTPNAEATATGLNFNIEAMIAKAIDKPANNLPPVPPTISATLDSAAANSAPPVPEVSIV